MHEHPSQYLIRCRDASRIASLLFEQDHITQIKIQDDRLGLLVMTRSRREFSRALTRISLAGLIVESVVAADENIGRALRVPDRRRAMNTAFRLRQVWTIARLQLRRVFFSKRSFWVYLLAFFPFSHFHRPWYLR